MASKTIRLPAAINEDQSAQAPVAGVDIRILNPDGTEKVAWTAMTTGADVGHYYYDYTAADTDQKGIYTYLVQTTTDVNGYTPIACGTFYVI